MRSFFKNIFEKVKDYDILLVAYEKEKENTLKSILNKIKDTRKNMKIAVLVVPVLSRPSTILIKQFSQVFRVDL